MIQNSKVNRSIPYREEYNMGLFFYACAYDILNKICCVLDADKFGSECRSFCEPVLSMHYLLRQKAYRVMWGGLHVLDNDNIEEFSRKEDLLGISTFARSYDFHIRNRDFVKDSEGKKYHDKMIFVRMSSFLWDYLDLYNEPYEYFNYENTLSVDYTGYLVNHTQNLAVDMEDYYRLSQICIQDICMQDINTAIDVVAVLTETGGGIGMFYNGISVDSTENLSGEWCGDLLQITNSLPDGYLIINCYFADAFGRARHCYKKFGANEDGYVVNDSSGKLFEAVKLDLWGRRKSTFRMKIEKIDERIKFIPTDEAPIKDELSYQS